MLSDREQIRLELGLGGDGGAAAREEVICGAGGGARMFWSWILVMVAQLCDCTKNAEL